jgi:hypothetical protein
MQIRKIGRLGAGACTDERLLRRNELVRHLDYTGDRQNKLPGMYAQQCLKLSILALEIFLDSFALSNAPLHTSPTTHRRFVLA